MAAFLIENEIKKKKSPYLEESFLLYYNKDNSDPPIAPETTIIQGGSFQ